MSKEEVETIKTLNVVLTRDPKKDVRVLKGALSELRKNPDSKIEYYFDDELMKYKHLIDSLRGQTAEIEEV